MTMRIYEKLAMQLEVRLTLDTVADAKNQHT